MHKTCIMLKNDQEIILKKRNTSTMSDRRHYLGLLLCEIEGRKTWYRNANNRHFVTRVWRGSIITAQ